MTGEIEEGREERDEELMREARSAPEGDLRAFEQLILQYQKRIVADCRYMTRDESNADDLAQEVFVKAYFGLRSFEGRSSFRHWLQRIKVHHCLNHIKKQEGKKEVPIDSDSAEGSEQLRLYLRFTRTLRRRTVDAGLLTFSIPCLQRFAFR